MVHLDDRGDPVSAGYLEILPGRNHEDADFPGDVEHFLEILVDEKALENRCEPELCHFEERHLRDEDSVDADFEGVEEAGLKQEASHCDPYWKDGARCVLR